MTWDIAPTASNRHSGGREWRWCPNSMRAARACPRDQTEIWTNLGIATDCLAVNSFPVSLSAMRATKSSTRSSRDKDVLQKRNSLRPGVVHASNHHCLRPFVPDTRSACVVFPSRLSLSEHTFSLSINVNARHRSSFQHNAQHSSTVFANTISMVSVPITVLLNTVHFCAETCQSANKMHAVCRDNITII